ncbi:Inositol-pentakisphosphate 2-kinase [Tetrabaena socialis]|uniref:Inositol-pentakisphosphate 2-kinase n=1 Tax=Tetrabaena socialis TaxID=47790 RepID=A0A2J8ADF9_9CHLO|nr:Inositol-pentakisphosphate 2-kinase [Tetrabaena socialis]|eukprot:PNH10554.1 Inositol-pentakisphosphate 2-kinase [Tetrabaena socialis]
MAWQLKGEGAANTVFSYCGDDPLLRGRVLRVRKASAHQGSAVDRAIWADVLGGAEGDAARQELSYVADVMAPLLGPQHVSHALRSVCWLDGPQTIPRRAQKSCTATPPRPFPRPRSRPAGVLSRLHAVQAGDSVGPGGALRLYQQLQVAMQAGEFTGTSSTQGETPVAGVLDASGAAPASAAPAGRDWAPVLASLRRYLMSVTAKDCGVMVTMQRARLLVDAHAAQEAAAAAAVPDGGVQLLSDPGTGLVFMYKVAFVDLDVKAAAKLPRHVELEAALADCGALNLPLLEELARGAGWQPNES